VEKNMIAAFDSLLPTVNPNPKEGVSASRFETQRTRTGPVLIFEMAKNELMALRSQRGQTVECLEGSLWITFDYDRRDIVVEVGQTFVVDGEAPGWIQALAVSRIRVTPDTGAAPKAR
jgi:hypothetical protein